MVSKYNDTEIIVKNLMESITEKERIFNEKRIARIIIDVYIGKYQNYDNYVNETKKEWELWNKSQQFNGFTSDGFLKYMPYPLVIPQHLFEYITNLRTLHDMGVDK